MKHAPLVALLALGLLTSAATAEQTLLLRQPDVSADHLVFVYAGDLWVAARDGSAPRRLTTSPVDESDPVFSPDGRLVAFAATHEDNRDVYVVSVEGGQPRRLTWHPDRDVPTGWTADGRQILMISNRETDHGRSGQLYSVSLEGGLPEKRMAARCFWGVYDDDDSHLAFMSHAPAYNGLFGGATGWKGYRGGTTPAIRIMDLKAQSSITVPGGGATNMEPIWMDGRLFFISDRDNEIYNLFRYDPADGSVTRISDETVWDIRAAGGHGGTLVYEAGGRLKALDVASGRTREIVVDIDPDLPQLRPQWKSAAGAVQSANISPTGKRALITARGDVFTVPVEDGSTRNITLTGDAREYTALWSPDGGRIAYIVDSLKGQKLVVVEQDGGGERKTYDLGSHFYFLRAWSSGDEPRIVYTDNHDNLFALTLDGGKIRRIATNARRGDFDVSLSPDGGWLAFTQEKPNFQSDLMLTDLSGGDTYRVSDGMADAAAPAFSPDGKYLFFAASTNSGPLQVGLNMTSQERPYRAGLYAVILEADGKSPLLPKTGDEEVKAEDDDEDKDKDADKKDEQEKDESPTLDVEGLADRIIALPVAERNYRNLAVGDDGALYYVQAVQPGATHEPPGSRAAEENALYRFDMEEKEAKSVLSGVNGFTLSADGKHMLISMAGGDLTVSETGASLEPKPVDMSGLRIRIDPREEWALIFDEDWRMQREYFYDPNMHGLDWDAVYKRYRPLIDHVGRREDLSALLVEMNGELQVGHNYCGGGDVHQEPGANTGLLGANLRVEDGRYRLARVYDGEAWNPFIDAPLAVPGNEARAGEYILSVNGRELTGDDNIWEFLQGTAGQQVTLEIGPKPNRDNSREIVVEPIRREFDLRLWRWIEDNRRHVDEATGGRVGYIYLPNTAGAGFTLFNRMFFAQLDKDALIIDERANAGGQAADYIVQVLSRAYLSGWKDRDGLVYDTPQGAMHGPKLMMIDQDAGSGGDYLPYAFRRLDIGKLLGKRTWGGLIGISHNPPLVDGGFLTVPFFRFYNADHEWSVENEGVVPDIEVDLDPIAANRGVDSQLEAAIAEILTELEGFVNPIPTEAPPFPTELGK